MLKYKRVKLWLIRGGIDVYDKGIVDLTGIEAFINITSLYCIENKLNSLDVSKNIALINLVCSYSNITTLNVTKNVALKYLECNNNNIKSLDINKNVALRYLNCDFNNLSSLDISKNIALVVLFCSANILSVLDVTQNVALADLRCNNNILSNLDVSKNIILRVLYCEYNTLSNLDVSKNTSLSELDCTNNLLTYLNVKNGANNKLSFFYAYENPTLQCIQVDNPNAIFADWVKDLTATYSSYCMIPTKDIYSEGFLQLYPNPSTESFAFSDLSEAPLSVAIYDLHGKLVQHYPTAASNYDIASLPNGFVHRQSPIRKRSSYCEIVERGVSKVLYTLSKSPRPLKGST